MMHPIPARGKSSASFLLFKLLFMSPPKSEVDEQIFKSSANPTDLTLFPIDGFGGEFLGVINLLAT
ncbi:hypothetical protein ACHAXS_005339 [Conticribra weissflogii]